MPKTRRVTLSDVASQAGVSVTTASYILNGRSQEMRISGEAASRVRAAAEQLSYRPNRNAQSLRTASTAAIGVISDHVASGPYASQMLSGASAAARASEHVLIIGETEGDPKLESKLIEEMLDRRVDGIVFVTLATCVIPLPALLDQQRVVLLNCTDVEGKFSSVVPDEYQGGRTAARTLIEAGRASNVWVIGEDPDPFVVAGPERMRGMADELGGSGLAIAGVLRCDWAVIPAYEATLELLTTGVVPSAVVCLNDRIAMGAYQAFQERGIHLPEEVAAVSFDGSDLAKWLRPAVTSVSIPYAELGALAVEMLLSGKEGMKKLRMPLVHGESI